jgi:hypothetical protein
MNILIKFIADIIIGPFLWLSARRLRKSDEWKDIQKNIAVLDKQRRALESKSQNLYAQWEKEQALKSKSDKLTEEYEKIRAFKKRNTKTFQSTQENKTSIGEPKFNIKLKALNASKSDYYNKNIKLCGYLSISTHYYNGYNNADDTHYSFLLTDKYGYTAQVYFIKGTSKNLFDKLIETDDLLVNIEAIPDKTKNKDNHDDILLEGIKYEILQYKTKLW